MALPLTTGRKNNDKLSGLLRRECLDAAAWCARWVVNRLRGATPTFFVSVESKEVDLSWNDNVLKECDSAGFRRAVGTTL